MKNILCSLIGHKLSIIGHIELLEGIKLHYTCLRCNSKSTELFKDNDPYIDEDSRLRSDTRRWSGYTWWMNTPLDKKVSKEDLETWPEIYNKSKLKLIGNDNKQASKLCGVILAGLLKLKHRMPDDLGPDLHGISMSWFSQDILSCLERSLTICIEEKTKLISVYLTNGRGLMKSKEITIRDFQFDNNILYKDLEEFFK